jgi:hypothetical protein
MLGKLIGTLMDPPIPPPYIAPGHEKSMELCAVIL